MRSILVSTLFLLLLSSCTEKEMDTNNAVRAVNTSLQTAAYSGLSDYWYQGEAEVSSYELQQNRYQDIHPGEAILVFVTEDFLTEKQVKNDNYTNPNSTGVLKTNFMRRFSTGIYDYSIMTSVFTPVETNTYPHTLKVTQSSQDWCGQSWMQLNKDKRGYQVQVRSYFENEGDVNTTSPLVLLEDELFNRLRMAPQQLPEGTFELLPSATYTRLKHRPFVPQQVTGKRMAYTGDLFTGASLQEYRIDFEEQKRSLQIIYHSKAPYIIEGWVDTYPSAFDKKKRITIAKRKKTIKSPYWKKNGLADTALRDSLQITRW